MALLIESNTGWGQSVMAKPPGVQALKADAVGEPVDQECRRLPMPFPCAHRASFPLHISRLRGPAAARLRTVSESAALAGGLSFELEERSPPRDRLPALTPEMTAATVETALGGLLDSLRKLPVTAIGIMATDKRDHLFLAQEISRRCPGVLLFSLEGSHLYLNRDFRPYLRGTLVASSYPLFSLTQRMVGPPSAGPLVEFSSMGEAGVYNALLALLDLPEKMLDYRSNEERSTGSPSPTWGPSVWLGVVGQDAIWPLTKSRPEREGGYSWRPQKVEAATLPLTNAQWPRSAIALYFVVGIAVLLHAGIAAGTASALIEARAQGGRRGASVPGSRVRAWLRRAVPIFEPPDLRARRWRHGSLGEDDASRHAVSSARLQEEYWLSILACAGALWCLLAWSGGLLRAGAGSVSHGPVPDGLLGVLRWLGTSWRRDLLGGLLVLGAVGALFPTPLRRRARVMALTALRLIPVGAGLFTLWKVRAVAEGGLLCGELAVLSALPCGELAGLNALRIASLGNFVSPTSVVLCFAAFAYFWGIWGLRRVHLQTARFNQSSPVFSLLGGDDPTGKRVLLDALNQPSLRLGFGLSLLLALFVGLQLAPGLHLGRALDGPDMRWLIVGGTAFSAFVVGHTLAHSLRLGASLLRCLRSLNLHPVGQAFGRVAREPFLWRFSLGIPDGRALAPLVRQAVAVSLAARRWGADLGTVTEAPALLPQPGNRRLRSYAAPPTVDAHSQAVARELRVRAGEVEAFDPHVLTPQVVRELGRDAHGEAPFQTTATWRRLEELSFAVRLALARGPWARAPYPAALPEASVAGGKPSALKPMDAPHAPAVFYREAETFLALELAYALRHALVRLLSGLTVALTGLLLILCAHLFYMFQGRTYWLTVDWLALGLSTVAALVLLVKLEKDAVLSRLWSTRPGRVDWSGEFVGRMIVYGALPVVTLFVTFFPEVGQSIFAWLEPVRKVLPY